MSKAITTDPEKTGEDLLPTVFELQGPGDTIVGRISGRKVWHRVGNSGYIQCASGGVADSFRPESWVVEYDSLRRRCILCFGENID